MSESLALILDLARLFISNPRACLKSLRPHNIRRLLSATARHNRATIIEIVTFYLDRETQLARLRKVADTHSPALNKVRELEANYPGITEAVGIPLICIIEEKLTPPAYVIDSQAPARINVFLPQLDPLIMFGGYISCLHFIRHVQMWGFQVRIVLCESSEFDRAAVDAKLAANHLLQKAIAACEVVNISRREDALTISPSDAFVCYSYWTGLKAHHLAQAIGKDFIFFLQEYEATFHPHDSCYAIAGHVYRLPHYAIFNTSLLADYFREKKLGVFGRYMDEELQKRYVCFQHALTPTTPPTLQELGKRRTKRLLFYGRPEGHARRNLFEIAVLGLKQAIRQNTFDTDWEFYGIGTLGTEHDVDLGQGRVLKLCGTLPQNDFGAALGKYDLGLSLMMAPHPSILPFEMVSAGLIVVTNIYETRTADVLRGISENIEPCEAMPESVASALAKAVARVNHHQQRIKGSDLNWVRDWDDSFNNEVMSQIAEMLRK